MLIGRRGDARLSMRTGQAFCKTLDTVSKYEACSMLRQQNRKERIHSADLAMEQCEGQARKINKVSFTL